MTADADSSTLVFVDVDGPLLPFKARAGTRHVPGPHGNPLIGRLDPEGGLHWKIVPLTRWAAGRPFVWLDDETTDADRRWVASHHPGPALLWRVDPYAGLAEADFAAVRRWLWQR